MGVQSARIGRDEQPRPSPGAVLLTCARLGLPEGDTVGGDPDDGHDGRAVPCDGRGQPVLPCAQLLEHKFSLGYLRKAGSNALCLAYSRRVMERRNALHTQQDGPDPWVGPSSKPFDGVHI